MADDVTVDNGGLTDYDVATDDDGSGNHVQIVKLAHSADGGRTPITADADGLEVKVTNASLTVDGSGVTQPVSGTITVTEPVSVDDNGGSLTVDNPVISVVGGGTEAAAQRVTIANDSTGVVSVDDNGSSLTVDGTVTVQDGGGSLTVDNTVLSVVGGGTEATAQRVTIANDSTGVVSVDDNGSTLSVDDGAGSLTVDNATISVVGGGAEATAQRVTIANDSTGVLSVDDNGGSLTVDGTVTVTDGLNVEGDVAHDAGDSGNPVKVGAKAANALPTAVANNDRTNNISDLFGRQLVNHIDAGMQVWKSVNVTTTQTGTDVWTPTSGKRIAITYLAISSYGTTGARVILWFGANADTTYTAGTDQLIWAGSFAPSATAKPGMVLPLGLSPIYAVTADHEIHLTTDAGISLDITVYGYEF